jgi:hypothetical protein
MRAKDLVNEDVEQNDLSHPSLKHVMHFPKLDRYYELYRLSLDMAELGSPEGIEGDSKGYPVKDHAVMVPYTDADEDIIRRAAKKRGYKHLSTKSKKNKEVDDVHKTSPVATIKKNRYGV